MKTKVRVGRELTIHIPKEIAEELNIKEGDLLTVEVKGNKIVLEANNAILISLKGKKFAKISPEEVEKISEEEQERYEGTS